MTKNDTKNAVPAGYETLAGNLPPFVDLRIEDAIHGQTFRFRTTVKSETVKTRDPQTKKVVESIIEKTKHYLDMTLVEGGEFNMGTVKKPGIRKLEAGQAVTLTVSGDLLKALRKKVWAEMGLGEDYWPKEGEEFPEATWSLLYGRRLFIRREDDGKVKKGEFAGNPKRRYTIALAPKAIVPVPA